MNQLEDNVNLSSQIQISKKVTDQGDLVTIKRFGWQC